MSHQIEREARYVAELLDQGYGQEAAQRLRQGIYELPRQQAVALLNATNQMELNDYGSDLIVKPVMREYVDRRTGMPYQTQEYLVSIRTPVNNRGGGHYQDGVYIDPMMRGQQDRFGRQQFDQHGRPIGAQQGYVDEFGRRYPPDQHYNNRRLFIQEDIGVIRRDGIHQIRSQPYYVEQRQQQIPPFYRR